MAAVTDDIVLSIEGLTKRVESGGSRFTLEVPSLKLRRGRFYGLVGRSGSGKSTMLDLLAMVARPTEVNAYEIIINGRSVNLAQLVKTEDDAAISATRINHFGYVLQSGGLFSFLTVLENLRLPFMLAKRPVDNEAIDRLVGLYGMQDQLHKKPASLSGGQRQRVSILRALCLSPNIILADEPTAAVDENMAELIVGELKRLAAERQATVIMVSHDLPLVSEFADELVTLRPEVDTDGGTRTIVRLGGE